MASFLLQFEVEFAPLDIYFLPVNGNPYLKQSSVAHRNLYLKVRTNDYQAPKVLSRLVESVFGFQKLCSALTCVCDQALYGLDNFHAIIQSKKL